MVWPFRSRTPRWREELGAALARAGVAHAWTGEAVLAVQAGPLAGCIVDFSWLGRRLERNGSAAVERLAQLMSDELCAPRRLERLGRLLLPCGVNAEAALVVSRSLLREEPSFAKGSTTVLALASSNDDRSHPDRLRLLQGDGRWRTAERPLREVAMSIADPIAWSAGDAVTDVRVAIDLEDELASALCDATEENVPASKLGGCADWIQWRHPRDRDGPVGANLVAQLNAYDVEGLGTGRVFLFELSTGECLVEFDHE